MAFGSDVLNNQEEKATNLDDKIKQIRESMENESNVFLKATKEFVFEWTLREMKIPVFSFSVEDPERTSYSLKIDSHKPQELKIDMKEFSEMISELVEAQLNIDDYWLHRNSLPQTELSQDYFEFKKEKMRKQLNSSIKIILGCCVEAAAQLKKEDFKNGGWVKEKGKLKYVCFLRFSDEMTNCLNQYFELPEKLYVLNYEQKEIKNK
ncbi:MAG: hypothetical protein ACPK85_03765 [Methanosarcina sp.]